MRRLRRLALIALVAAIRMSSPATQAQAQPVVFDIRTNHGGDTIYLGNEAELVFWVDAGPHELAGIVFSYQYVFTGGVTVDALIYGDNFSWSAYTNSTFASKAWNEYYGAKTPQDTVCFAGTSFGGPWTGAHEFARIRLEVTDTGTVYLDSIVSLPSNSTTALDLQAQDLPLDWRPGPIVVVPCPFMVGDLNASSTITLADVILLVNYVFKSGPAPQPHVKMGDTDCSTMITSADIIYLVNYQGKGGPAPCPCFIP